MFHGVESDAGSLGQLSLIEILSEPERPDLATKRSFPFVGGSHNMFNRPK
jgi:hypothetical protein